MFLYFIVFVLAISHFILSDDDKKSVVLSGIETYQLMFGENPEADDLQTGKGLKLVSYVIATNTIVIVCLNILISLVTDNYDNVQSRMNAIDQK